MKNELTVNVLLEDLVKHKFYDLNKSYSYIYKKYKIKPFYITSYKPQNGIVYEKDVYKLSDGKLEILGTTNKDFNILCEYTINKNYP